MPEITLQELAALFSETAAAHHRAFAATNGDDPDWADWYAEYLTPRLHQALGQRFDVAALAGHLRRLDSEHRSSQTRQPWPEFYARSFLSLNREMTNT
jgi:hypothetical protein